MLLTTFGLLLVGIAATGLLFAGAPPKLAIIRRTSYTTPNSHQNSTMAVSGAENEHGQDLYLKGRFEWNKPNPEGILNGHWTTYPSVVHDPPTPMPIAYEVV